jgi:uroporphyrinogen-III synthase
MYCTIAMPLQDACMDIPPAAALHGRRILVTRAAEQAAQTEALIRARGGEPVPFPCLAIACQSQAIRNVADRLADPTIDIAFTSANGVRCVSEALTEPEGRQLGRHRLAAVGSHTASAMAEHGWPAAIVAASASQDGLIAAYRRAGLPQSLLLFRAEEGRDLLPDWLRGEGVDVSIVHAYRSVCPEGDASPVIAALRTGTIDAVLLGSARTAAHYARRIGDAGLASRPVLVAISPEVAEAAAALGLGVKVVAPSASFSSMLDALARHYLIPTE